MSITKDAIKVLNHMCKRQKPSFKDIVEGTGWKGDRVTSTLDYLHGKELIEGRKMLDRTYRGLKCTSSGIDEVEKGSKFKKYFGVEIGIPGVFKFKGGAKEK